MCARALYRWQVGVCLPCTLVCGHALNFHAINSRCADDNNVNFAPNELYANVPQSVNHAEHCMCIVQTLPFHQAAWSWAMLTSSSCARILTWRPCARTSALRCVGDHASVCILRVCVCTTACMHVQWSQAAGPGPAAGQQFSDYIINHVTCSHCC